MMAKALGWDSGDNTAFENFKSAATASGWDGSSAPTPTQLSILKKMKGGDTDMMTMMAMCGKGGKGGCNDALLLSALGGGGGGGINPLMLCALKK